MIPSFAQRELEPIIYGVSAPFWLRLRRFDYWLPIRRSEQVVFAEAFAQALTVGLSVVDAAMISALVNPSFRFRQALHGTVRFCRQGYPLAISLEKTWAKVLPGLLNALRVGEESGCLAGELSAFARRNDPKPELRLARAVGRSRDVMEFAACLARLLEDQRLHPSLVKDAGRIAAGTNRNLERVIDRVAEAIRNGDPFSWALNREAKTFDPLFRRFVEEAKGRDELRFNLSLLGRGLGATLPFPIARGTPLPASG